MQYSIVMKFSGIQEVLALWANIAIITLISQSFLQLGDAAGLMGGRPVICTETDPTVELDPWEFIDRDYNGKDDIIDLCMIFYCKNGELDIVPKWWSERCEKPKTPEHWRQYHSQAAIRAQKPTGRPDYTLPPRHLRVSTTTTTLSPRLSASTTFTSKQSRFTTTTTARPVSKPTTSTTTTARPTTTTTTTVTPTTSRATTTAKLLRTASSTTTTTATTMKPNDDGVPVTRTRRPRPYRGDEPPPEEDELDYSGILTDDELQSSDQTTTEEPAYELYDDNDPEEVRKVQEELERYRKEKLAKFRAEQEEIQPEVEQELYQSYENEQQQPEEEQVEEEEEVQELMGDEEEITTETEPPTTTTTTTTTTTRAPKPRRVRTRINSQTSTSARKLIKTINEVDINQQRLERSNVMVAASLQQDPRADERFLQDVVKLMRAAALVLCPILLLLVLVLSLLLLRRRYYGYDLQLASSLQICEKSPSNHCIP